MGGSQGSVSSLQSVLKIQQDQCFHHFCVGGTVGTSKLYIPFETEETAKCVDGIPTIALALPSLAMLRTSSLHSKLRSWLVLELHLKTTKKAIDFELKVYRKEIFYSILSDSGFCGF